MIEQRLELLDSWIAGNGYEGYDVYDLLSIRVFRLFQKNRYTTFALKMILDMFPFGFRKLFHVRKRINAKAMALFADSYLNLYKRFDEEKYRKKAVFCLDWLMKNPSKGYSGLCWGYPFDWQSRTLIPKNTPSSVVTSISAHAFLDAFEILEEPRYLEVAKSCCDFIMQDLNIDRIAEDKLCFSYTPIDTLHVHNANMFCASILYRVGALTSDESYIKLAKNAVNYTIREQNEDGSWYYFGIPEKMQGRIDNYHTGFVLRNLFEVYKITKDEVLWTCINKGLAFYTTNLFEKAQIPKFHHNISYPIDIHACAESILCLSKLSEVDPKAIKIAETVATWTIENMQSTDGYFYYRKYRLFTSKIPYIRWGQAWMLYALSVLTMRLEDAKVLYNKVPYIR